MPEIIVPGEPNADSQPQSTETPKEGFDFNSPDLAEKVAALKAKLGIVANTPTEETLTPEAIQARQDAANQPDAITGKDVNWEDYELDPKLAHFYPKATLVETEQGPQWVAVIDEFISNNKQYVNHGISKNGEPLGAGEYATWMLNGPEGWKLVAFLPNGSGMVGIILQRKVRVSLPDPKMVETEVKVEAPTDAELKATEDKGLEWAGVAGAQEAAEEAVVALEGPDFGTDPLGGSQPVEGADYVAPEQSSESGQ